MRVACCRTVITVILGWLLLAFSMDALAFTPVFKKLNGISHIASPEVSFDSLQAFKAIRRAFEDRNYERVVNLYENSPFFQKKITNRQLLLWVATSYVYIEDYQKALTLISPVLDIEDIQPQFLELGGIIYLNMGLIDPALRTFKQAYERQKGPHQLLGLCAAQVKAGKINEFLETLTFFETRFNAATHPWFYYYAGVASMCKGDHKKAANDFKTFLTLAETKGCMDVPKDDLIKLLDFIKREGTR